MFEAFFFENDFHFSWCQILHFETSKHMEEYKQTNLQSREVEW